MGYKKQRIDMYYTSTSNPSAWVVSSKDKGRKKVYLNSKIYLENNSEFEIELWNPLQEPVLAEIKINGKVISSTGIIIKNGQRFYLDCSIDDKRKFIFKTYEIENTSESHFATANNGYVEISFFREKTKYYNQYFGCNTLNTIPCSTYTIQPGWPGSTIQCSSTGGNLFNTSNLSNTNTTACYSSNTSSMDRNLSANLISKSIDKTETGRIEKGANSNQKFESVSMEFDTYCLNRISYQILPESKKPVETSELKKNFCVSCGFKNKDYKFCPSCGTRI